MPQLRNRHEYQGRPMGSPYGGRGRLTSLTSVGGQDDRDETWQDGAVCAQTDPEVFYPEKGGSTKDAKKVCLGCPVRDKCLEYALEHDERWGVWGGLSERERRALARRRRSTPTAVEPQVDDGEIARRYAAGQSLQHLAVVFGIHVDRVRTIAEDAGVPIRQRGGQPAHLRNGAA